MDRVQVPLRSKIAKEVVRRVQPRICRRKDLNPPRVKSGLVSPLYYPLVTIAVHPQVLRTLVQVRLARERNEGAGGRINVNVAVEKLSVSLVASHINVKDNEPEDDLSFEAVLEEFWRFCVKIGKTKRPHSQESCLLYTSPSPRDRQKSRMPSSA